ncbi:MAG: T9SS type A sorting domain-containing protein [Bacteroidota bacterium]
MKKLLLSLAIIIGFFALPHSAGAQTFPPLPLVYGSSPFQDSLWAFDTTGSAYTVKVRMGPTLPGFTITGMNGLAFDPCGLKTYIILKVSGVTGRVLATIDLKTGVCTQIGNLGDKFSSITFDRTGQLYGVTGNGATVPETFFSIDKTTAATTMLTALGNGADGEVICYNYYDNMIYHWSGNGTLVYEKFSLTPPYTITGISGALGLSETFGALYLSPNRFLHSNISSAFHYLDTLGVYGGLLATNPDDIRGLVFPPAFAINTDTICAKESITVAATGLYLHKAYYYWGDGNGDTIVNGGATHQYNSFGNFTITVLLDDGYCTPDTAYTVNIRVNPLPNVGLSGNTSLCPGGSLLLTGSSGGTSQWYFNGILIPGASSHTYLADSAGTYNMTKTNTNGCVDSAALSLIVVDVTNPVVNLGPDTVICAGILLDAQNTGSSFSWNDLSTSQGLYADTTSLYWVVVTDTNGCTANDSVNVTVNPLPVVTYVELLDTVCLNAGDLTLTAGSPAGGVYTGTGVLNDTFNTITGGTGPNLITYTYTDGNGCVNSDASVIVVNALPEVAYVELQDTVCINEGNITLTAGTPTGGTYSGAGVTGSTFNTTTAGIGTFTITYNYTDGYGCSNSVTSQITVDPCSGIRENAATLRDYEVFPNPSTGIFNLQSVSGNGREVNISVYNSIGKLVYEALTNAAITGIDLRNLADGIYTISLRSAQSNKVIKVLKQQ